MTQTNDLNKCITLPKLSNNAGWKETCTAMLNCAEQLASIANIDRLYRGHPTDQQADWYIQADILETWAKRLLSGQTQVHLEWISHSGRLAD